MEFNWLRGNGGLSETQLAEEAHQRIRYDLFVRSAAGIQRRKARLEEEPAVNGNFYPRHSKLRSAGPADDRLVKVANGPPISPVGPYDAPATDPSEPPIAPAIRTEPNLRRIRDREHVRRVAEGVCLVCGREPVDAHYPRFTQSGEGGRKVSDDYTVPLCREHHRDLHRYGNEPQWWRRFGRGIDPIKVARALWLQTHPPARGVNDTAAVGGDSSTPAA
jgi:hypothetical protein